MLSVNGETIKLDNFPDGTLLVKFATKDPVIQLEWKYENDAELFALICLSKHIKELNPSADRILKLHYIPNARMDRVKEKEDVFTLKYFAEIINSLDFSKVMVLDPHSEVSLHLIHNIEAKSPKPYIDEAIRRISKQYTNPTTVFFTDKGGKERYDKMLELPSIYGDKVRDWNTGNIIATTIIGDLQLVKDKDIIIVDDIIAYGGSIYHNSLKLKELGCRNLYVFVTHMENSILDKKKGQLIKSGLITRFYTTDSLFTKKHKLIEIMKLDQLVKVNGFMGK